MFRDKCDRCDQSISGSTTMSIFNEDVIIFRMIHKSFNLLFCRKNGFTSNKQNKKTN